MKFDVSNMKMKDAKMWNVERMSSIGRESVFQSSNLMKKKNSITYKPLPKGAFDSDDEDDEDDATRKVRFTSSNEQGDGRLTVFLKQ